MLTAACVCPQQAPLQILHTATSLGSTGKPLTVCMQPPVARRVPDQALITLHAPHAFCSCWHLSSHSGPTPPAVHHCSCLYLKGGLVLQYKLPCSLVANLYLLQQKHVLPWISSRFILLWVLSPNPRYGTTEGFQYLTVTLLKDLNILYSKLPLFNLQHDFYLLFGHRLLQGQVRTTKTTTICLQFKKYSKCKLYFLEIKKIGDHSQGMWPR